MSFFRKLFGDSSSPRRSVAELDAVRESSGERRDIHVLGGSADLFVVGEANYQSNLRKLVGRAADGVDPIRQDITAVLVAEDDNRFDDNAISAWINGLKVGYLSRDDAARYRSGLIALEAETGRRIALKGVIAGGGLRADGQGRLGVFLRHDPTDFGLRRRRPTQRAGTMRTGLTEAIESDLHDDSYDLGWLDGIPADPLRAIPMLRKLLNDERDPIDRHFMFHQLEEALYRSRDVFSSALSEYDACCKDHDFEMDAIRSAFIAKWGEVPRIETYHQMCKRLAKGKQFAQAVEWAERGLAIYGTDAARSDAVEDLIKRANDYRAKMSPPVDNPSTAESREPSFERITCVNCGATFERLMVRGRKPAACPACRAR